ncbi:YHS domain-containing protein [Pedobacter xixiisoli]|uniref:YHS domain-containing protein n=1 Tax=Pedobacter xixiisoli TaxID=1476464 RepID=A0A285ZUD8_9SPHI|nr:YHS domain-containing protein [Pedobacter xixiisoli]SOD13242.1 YHS domain-containing protein [Pedobacter xixiisoli]
MKTTLIICIFALSFGALYNSNATEVNKQGTSADSVKTDLVCKMKIKPSTNLKSTYQKQEYLFCSKGCKLKFDQNPEKYLKK